MDASNLGAAICTGSFPDPAPFWDYIVQPVFRIDDIMAESHMLLRRNTHYDTWLVITECHDETVTSVQIHAAQ